MDPETWLTKVMEPTLNEAFLNAYFPKQSRWHAIWLSVSRHFPKKHSNSNEAPFFLFRLIALMGTACVLSAILSDLGMLLRNFINGVITFFMPAF